MSPSEQLPPIFTREPPPWPHVTDVQKGSLRMPPKSSTENVRKICGCVKWKTCTHPWYLDYTRDNLRFRDNLDRLTGRHAEDFAAAKDEARRAITAKLEGLDPRGLVPQDDPTLAEMLTAYTAERPAYDRWQLPKLLATDVLSSTGVRPIGQWRLSTITLQAIKDFQRSRPRVAGNRDLALLRAAFNWAVLKGLVARTPFRVGDVAAVRFHREEGRSRRLHPGEEEKLLAHAGRLGPLIIAALETGCRKGELLSLQWHQVRFTPKAEIFLPAGKTKAKKDRRVPISSVLRDLLEGRRLDPAGDPLPPEAYIFGDEIGRPRASIKTAWGATMRRAKIADLHFHDLRREAGSRWMDAGVPLATIQRWLGHFNISQTSTYLGASIGGDEQDMAAFEARLGRVTRESPVTHNDVTPLTEIDRPAPREAPRREQTHPRSREIPQKNRKEQRAIPTVH